MMIRNYIATQRPLGLPTVENYVPLIVGKPELAFDGALNDSTGDSISARNNLYCELTGHYWIWRNDRSSSIVGLCQYRRCLWLDRPPRTLCSRNFPSVDACSDHIDTRRLSSLLDDCDVILPRPYAFSRDDIRSQFIRAHRRENFDQMLRSIDRTHPECSSTARRVFSRRYEYLANLLIARKPLFDEYSQWLFDVLFDVECAIDTTDPRNARLLGYMGERLLNVFVEHRRLRVREVPLIFIDASEESARIDLRYLKRRYLSRLLAVEQRWKSLMR